MIPPSQFSDQFKYYLEQSNYLILTEVILKIKYHDLCVSVCIRGFWWLLNRYGSPSRWAWMYSWSLKVPIKSAKLNYLWIIVILVGFALLNLNLTTPLCKCTFTSANIKIANFNNSTNIMIEHPLLFIAILQRERGDKRLFIKLVPKVFK